MALLTDYTFKDTGIQVKIRKISPLMASDVARAIPEPIPPENEVDYGEGKGRVRERNYSDPNYLAAMADYRRHVSEVIQRVMILRSVYVTGEDWKAEVAEYRDFMKQQTGSELEEKEDLVIYVLRICVGTQEDLEELIESITKRSQPTEELVEAAKRSFRGEVPRP